MNIWLDNIIFSLQKAGGISVVWQNLITNLLDLLDKNDVLKCIEYRNSLQNIFRQKLDISESQIECKNKIISIFDQLKSPKITSKEKFIFHSSYFRICNNPNAVNVTTIHDFIYEQGHPTCKQKLRIWLNYRAIRKSDAIVCISENTKKDLLRYLPEVNSSKVSVIYNGVSKDYYQMDEIPYPKYNRYVLFVGGRHGYKNFNFVVKSLKNTTYNLLICGFPLTHKERELLELYIPNRYDIIEYPSNYELNKIYNSVYCLIYPSSYEGFGLPVVEAQRAGCPVIALSASSIPEIVGDYSLLMSELDESCLIELLARLENRDIRTTAINSGLDAANRFSWEKMTENYLKLYRTLLEK